MALSDIIVRHFDVKMGQTTIQSAPLRGIEAVISRMGFLEARTIIRRGAVAAVEGLTTAAALLFVAGVGIAVALSPWVLAVVVIVLASATLRVLYVFSRWFERF